MKTKEILLIVAIASAGVVAIYLWRKSHEKFSPNRGRNFNISPCGKDFPGTKCKSKCHVDPSSGNGECITAPRISCGPAFPDAKCKGKCIIDSTGWGECDEDN
jgi:hypothetical protein